MSITIGTLRDVLTEVGIESRPVLLHGAEALLFENDLVLGFAVFYQSSESLMQCWREDIAHLAKTCQFGLRFAREKAWNAYAVLLTSDRVASHDGPLLSAIEEDLVGTRKIARGGISTTEQLKLAILPLLPLQSAPRLEAFDMATEIRLRTTELPPHTVDAFLSRATDALVLTALEAGP